MTMPQSSSPPTSVKRRGARMGAAFGAAGDVKLQRVVEHGRDRRGDRRRERARCDNSGRRRAGAPGQAAIDGADRRRASRSRALSASATQRARALRRDADEQAARDRARCGRRRLARRPPLAPDARAHRRRRGRKASRCRARRVVLAERVQADRLRARARRRKAIVMAQEIVDRRPEGGGALGAHDRAARAVGPRAASDGEQTHARLRTASSGATAPMRTAVAASPPSTSPIRGPPDAGLRAQPDIGGERVEMKRARPPSTTTETFGCEPILQRRGERSPRAARRRARPHRSHGRARARQAGPTATGTPSVTSISSAETASAKAGAERRRQAANLDAAARR